MKATVAAVLFAAGAAAADSGGVTAEFVAKVPGLPTTVALLIFFSILVALIKRFRKVWVLEKIPGPFALPFVGNALQIRGTHHHLFMTLQWFCTYGTGVCRMYLGLQPYCMLYRAKAVEAMLNSNFLLDKSKDYKYLQPWMGTGLLTAKSSKWRSRRKLLTPSFHFKILDEFLAVMNQRTLRLVKKLEAHTDGKPFNVAPMVTLCTLDIIMGAVMGCDFDVQENRECEYVSAVKGMGELVHTRQSSPWLQNDLLFSLFGYAKEQAHYVHVLHTTSRDAIKQRRAEEPHTEAEADQVLGQKKRLAFLDLLLKQAKTKEGASFSDEDIREEVDTFLFAGHDTTASAVTFCLYLLARNPEIQESVYEELCQVTGGEGGQDPLENHHLRDLNLLERCIKESLRIFPPVPFFARHLYDTKVFDGYAIPGGSIVMVNTYALHRDPKQFPDPERYDPDRFLPEASATRHPYAYVPFSAGNRNCIGQKFAMLEQKVVVGTILRNYRLSTTQEPEQMQLKGELVLQADSGVYISLCRRS